MRVKPNNRQFDTVKRLKIVDSVHQSGQVSEPATKFPAKDAYPVFFASVALATHEDLLVLTRKWPSDPQGYVIVVNMIMSGIVRFVCVSSVHKSNTRREIRYALSEYSFTAYLRKSPNVVSLVATKAGEIEGFLQLSKLETRQTGS